MFKAAQISKGAIVVATIHFAGRSVPRADIPIFGTLALVILVASGVAGYKQWLVGRLMVVFGSSAAVLVVVVVATGPHPQHARPDVVTFLLTVELIAWMLAYVSAWVGRFRASKTRAGGK